MTRRFAFLLALLFPAVVYGQPSCPATVGAPVRVDIAGWTLPTITDVHGNDASAVTVIDVSHPAVVRVTATQLTFKYVFVDSRPVQIVVGAMRAAGDEYRAVDVVPPFEITPQDSPSALRTIALSQPLHFEPGDMLAIEFKTAEGVAPGLITYGSPARQGVLALAMEIGGPTMHPFPFVNPFQSTAIAAAVQGQGTCDDFPPAELLLPVVGELDGVVHYSTEVNMSSGPLYPLGYRFNWTLRDRLRDPNAATIFKGTSRANPQNGIATISDLPPAYVGSLIIDTGTPVLPIPEGARIGDFFAARATIKAGASGSAGAGSIDAVSCEALAHTIALPFHLSSGQRLNIGIASADLRGCGIVVPATSVLVRMGGNLPVPIAMPAGSVQLNDVTGPKTPLPAAAGVTDGFVYVTVTDEASRVVAYSSIVDGASQTIAYGMTLR